MTERTNQNATPANRMGLMPTPTLLLVGAAVFGFSGLGGLGGLLGIGEKWTRADYSHGFIVVPFAIYLLWKNLKSRHEAATSATLLGLPLTLGAIAIYFVETKINVAMEWVQGACFLVVLFAIALTLTGSATASRGRLAQRLGSPAALLALIPVPFGLLQWLAPKVLIGALPGERYSLALYACFGALAMSAVILAYLNWAVIRWVFPTLLMLALALPLPDSVETTLGFKLREFATTSAMYAFRMFGLATHMPSSVSLNVNNIELSVEAACSGLSMLLAFVALTAAIVLMCPPNRSLSDRMLIFLSAIPIAVFCNVLRIILSGLVLVAGWKQAFDLIVHDFAGWLMMPIALGLIWLEFKLLDWLYMPVSYLSREEVAKASFAEARAEIERAESERKNLQDTMSSRTGRYAAATGERHPAAAFLPLTPAGTSHGATAAGGTAMIPPTTTPPTRTTPEDTPPPPESAT